jgi:hypothetical protein
MLDFGRFEISLQRKTLEESDLSAASSMCPVVESGSLLKEFEAAWSE